LVEQALQLPEVHHKLEKVYLVQQNFQNQRVFPNFKIDAKGSITDFQNLPEISRALVKSIVVCLLADHQCDFHKE